MIINQKGVVFITALAVMVILLTLGAGYLFISRTQIDIGINQGDALKAFYIAQAGMEYSIAELKDDTDIDGDGNIGDISLKSLDDLDVANSYSASYGSDTITSVGTCGGASRTIVAEVSFTLGYASHAGRDIDFGNLPGGNIRNGNVHGNDDVDLGGVSLDTGYSSTEGDETVPTVSFSAYETAVQQADPAKVIDGNKTFTAVESPYTGLWFIKGKATIESNVTINGTVIAYGETGQNGNIDMQNESNITITPTGNYPALMAENQILLNNTSNIEITGLIYGEKDLNLNGSSSFTLNNGAIVIQRDIKGNSQTTGLDITYSPGLNPPDFTITGTSTGITVTSWQGHP